MNQDYAVVLFIGFFVIVVIGIVASARAAKRRREALLLLSQRLGFVYYPEGLMSEPAGGFLASISQMFAPTPDAVFVQRFETFFPFGQGESPDVDNLLVGSRKGRDWYLFDYSYKTRSTNSDGSTQTTTHSFGVAAARVPLRFPTLSLAPETVFHRIGNKLGYSELTFELEEFNRRYFIRSPDSKLAYDLLHPQAIDYLMRQPVRHWQMGGLYILITRPGSFDPLEMERVMLELEGFLDLVPTYYQQDHGFQARWSNPLD